MIDECTLIKGRFAEEAEKKKIEDHNALNPKDQIEQVGPDIGDGDNLLNDLPF